MATASPDTLGTVLSQIVQEATDQGAAQAAQLRQILDEAGHTFDEALNKVEKLPDDAIQRIKDLYEHPDWWSLLVFVLVQVSKLDDHMSVGTTRPEGWSRAVTVTYTVGDSQELTLGLALTDPDVKHGILVTATAPLTVGPIGNALTLRVDAKSACNWTWEFGGTPESPDPECAVEIDLAWQPPMPVLSSDAGGISVGPLHLNVKLTKGRPDPLYAITLGLGTSAQPGVEAQLHAGEALGALARFVQISELDERYSPSVMLKTGQSPQYTLGHSGI